MHQSHSRSLRTRTRTYAHNTTRPAGGRPRRPAVAGTDVARLTYVHACTCVLLCNYASSMQALQGTGCTVRCRLQWQPRQPWPSTWSVCAAGACMKIVSADRRKDDPKHHNNNNNKAATGRRAVARRVRTGARRLHGTGHAEERAAWAAAGWRLENGV